jgi:hypothetical protein
VWQINCLVENTAISSFGASGGGAAPNIFGMEGLVFRYHDNAELIVLVLEATIHKLMADGTFVRIADL